MSVPKHSVWLLALLLVAALWLATLAAERTPRSKPVDAAPTEFSGERAKALLWRLVGDDVPHPLGSAADAQLRERIVGTLEGLGLAPVLQSGVMVCSHYGVCGLPTNILARIEGTEPGAGAVLLAAHYDSVAAGPGASDDGSGVAAVLEIARILQLLPRPRQSIILLLDEGEEQGLLGAQAFVQRHPWAAGVGAAVNVEARGTSGPSLMFETGHANRWLMSLYAAAIARPLTNSVYYAVYRRLPNDTDFSVFRAAGYQGFNFAFIGDVAHYHTPLDNWQHVDAGSLQQQGENALATLLALANAAPGPVPSGEAVYFDLFGRLLVRIPQSWMWPASSTVLLLLVAVGARLLHLQWLRLRALLWGIVSLGATLAIGSLGAAALLALLRAIGAVSAGGATAAVAHPWALELIFAALAFCALALGSRLRRRAGAEALAYAAALLYSLLALMLARALAGASYLALLPALAALLALLPSTWPATAGRGRSAWSARELAALAPCAVMFTLLWPIVVPLYAALGADGLSLVSLLLIYGGFSLAPLRGDHRTARAAPGRCDRRAGHADRADGRAAACAPYAGVAAAAQPDVRIGWGYAARSMDRRCILRSAARGAAARSSVYCRCADRVTLERAAVGDGGTGAADARAATDPAQRRAQCAAGALPAASRFCACGADAGAGVCARGPRHGGATGNRCAAVSADAARGARLVAATAVRITVAGDRRSVRCFRIEHRSAADGPKLWSAGAGSRAATRAAASRRAVAGRGRDRCDAQLSPAALKAYGCGTRRARAWFRIE